MYILGPVRDPNHNVAKIQRQGEAVPGGTEKPDRTSEHSVCLGDAGKRFTPDDNRYLSHLF